MRSFTALGLTFMVTAANTQSSWTVTEDEVTETRNNRSVVRIDPGLEEFLQQAIHDNHHRCGGYKAFDTQQAALDPALNMVDASNILSTINWMQKQGNRHYQSAAGAAQVLKTQWQGYATRPDFSVETVNHAWLQDSVIATITGVSKPDEVIVIGGHLSSINAANVNAAPGADDNASGIAVASEILRVMLASGFKPQRTIKFIGYAAEKVRLRGPREIAEDMVDDPDLDVIAALQFDMTRFSGLAQAMYFFSDYVSTDLTDDMKLLTGENHGRANRFCRRDRHNLRS